MVVDLGVSPAGVGANFKQLFTLSDRFIWIDQGVASPHTQLKQNPRIAQDSPRKSWESHSTRNQGNFPIQVSWISRANMSSGAGLDGQRGCD